MNYLEELQAAQANLEARRREAAAVSSSVKDLTIPTIQGVNLRPKNSPKPTRPLLNSKNSTGSEQPSGPQATSLEPPVWTCPTHGDYSPLWVTMSKVLNPRGGRWVGACPGCKVAGAEARKTAADVRRSRNIAKRLSQIGLMENPERRLSDLKRDVHNARAMIAAEAWLRARSGGLFLWGPPSRGKTSLLEACAVESAMALRVTRYWLLGDFLDQARAHNGDRALVDVVGEAKSADVLILDNLDGVSINAYARGVLSELVIARYQRRASSATAFGATVEPREVADALDVAAVGARWQDWGEVVEMIGPDRRAKR